MIYVVRSSATGRQVMPLNLHVLVLHSHFFWLKLFLYLFW